MTTVVNQTPAPTQAQPQTQAIVSKDGVFTRIAGVIQTEHKHIVYRGFNMQDGVEVLWHTINIESLSDAEKQEIQSKFERIIQLKHNNIVSILTFWLDDNGTELHFITELMSSGSLNDFMTRPGKLGRNTLKRWCIQILLGLNYLHSQNPPIVHGKIICQNIFFNGSTGQIKIACWDLALQFRDLRSPNIIEHPEILGPEMFEDGGVNELVDIYGFGISVLQLATKKIPYSECKSPKEIYDKIQNRTAPESLNLVQDPQIHEMIAQCLADKTRRPTAADLLACPFLDTRINTTKKIEKVNPVTIAISESNNSVTLTHKIIDTALLSMTVVQDGKVREIQFPFNMKSDTVQATTDEMCRELNLAPPSLDLVRKTLNQFVELYSVSTPP
eukprot:c17661_g1_i2.p1 GENE.c17661_g1_i2~~c17661_g1_i2.p1  ORF type:complete len:387 (-),score=124.46 c17661_g1_i2:34-1194(-)